MSPKQKNIITTEILEKFVEKAPELREYIESNEIILQPNHKSPFEVLVHSIIYQQLSGKAASTILQRFLTLIGELKPENILSKNQKELRSVGLSRQKASYVQNVAKAFKEDGFLAEYQSSEDLKTLSSDEIIELFTQIKGVGNWTVEMYLIFGLGRLDVLSVKDLGVRKGIQKMYDLKELPTPGKAKRFVKHWAPLQSIGTILSWRVLDE